jgi:CO/xanthine dehydrogenase FAD-binding subunit
VEGFRSFPLATFFLGPGKTVLKPGDVVTAIQFPVPAKGSMGTYIKLGRNRLSDLSIVGVTALGYPDASAASGFRFRLALASVAPVPLEVKAVEEHLAVQAITPDALKQAAALAYEACTPIDDVRGGARYRKEMVRNLSLKALEMVWRKLESKER